MDLMTRRRALLSLVESSGLDTSPRIAEYGSYLGRGNDAVYSDPNYCYTDWYDLDFNGNASLTMVYANMPENPNTNNVCYHYRNTITGTKDWYYFPRNVTISSSFNQIQFSIETAKLTTCYLYFQQTGEILFAGRNTPYYGYTNINDMPTGT